MKLMLDLNVLLDVVQRRKPFYAASARVLTRVILRKASGCLPAHALTTLHYIVSRHASREQADETVDWVLAYLEIVPQDRTGFVRARGLDFSDFEDAAVASAAEAAECEYIITRNVTDFEGSPIPAITPEEFLSRKVKSPKTSSAAGEASDASQQPDAINPDTCGTATPPGSET